MPDQVDPGKALELIEHLISDLEQRLDRADSDLEKRALTKVLQVRRLEAADFRDQLNDQGDLP